MKGMRFSGQIFDVKVISIDRFKRKVYFAPHSTFDKPFEGSYLNYYRLIN